MRWVPFCFNVFFSEVRGEQLPWKVSRYGVTQHVDATHETVNVTNEPDKFVLVVVMIESRARDLAWRNMVRWTLRELTIGVRAGGQKFKVLVHFAIGRSTLVAQGDVLPRPNSFLVEEAMKYSDVAILETADGSRNNSKIWFIFDWVMRHYSDVSLVFHQDDDAIVDWRRALPRLLEPIYGVGPIAIPLENLYLGRLCAWQNCGHRRLGPCASGMLYGFSSDIVRWVLNIKQPKQAVHDDMVVCGWARGFERRQDRLSRTAFLRLDPRGILLPNGVDDVWIHPLKDRSSYVRCYTDRTHGCTIFDPQKQHFKLPGIASELNSPHFV